MLKSFAQTHIGQRKINEDSYFIDVDLGLYIVADGVGGLAKGEVASKITCQSIHDAIKSGKTLVEAVESAHNNILNKMQSDESMKGMASTVVVALFKGNKYQIAWVGDSRAYLWDGGLKLITRDHSYVELLYEKGHITFEQMGKHPNKNVISQALGSIGKDIVVDLNNGTLEKNQILFLATDGLYEIAQEKVMIDGINNIKSTEELTEALVTHAVKNNGKDNITLITIHSDSDSKNSSEKLLAEVVRTFDSESGEVEEVADNNQMDIEKLDDKTPQIKSVQPKSIKVQSRSIEPQKQTINKGLTLLIILSIITMVTLLIFKEILK